MKKLLSVLALLIIFTTAFVSSATAAPPTTDRNIEVFHPEVSKTVDLGKERFTFKKFVDENTSKAVSLVEIAQPPQYEGFLFKKHILKTPEVLYVLEGDFEFLFSQTDKRMKVTQGDIVHTFPGLPYGFKNVGTRQGRILVMSNSTALPDFLEEAGTPKADESIIPIAPPNFDKVTSVAKKYGIEILN